MTPFILNSGELVEVRFLGPRKWALYTSETNVIEDALAQPEVAGLDAYQTLNPLAPEAPEKHGGRPDVLFQALRGAAFRGRRRYAEEVASAGFRLG
jgi:hypothetical protein